MFSFFTKAIKSSQITQSDTARRRAAKVSKLVVRMVRIMESCSPLDRRLLEAKLLTNTVIFGVVAANLRKRNDSDHLIYETFKCVMFHNTKYYEESYAKESLLIVYKECNLDDVYYQGARLGAKFHQDILDNMESATVTEDELVTDFKNEFMKLCVNAKYRSFKAGIKGVL